MARTRTATVTPDRGSRKPAQPGSDQMSPHGDTPVRPLYLGLARCSTLRQADEGHTLAAQEARLRDEAERRGWDIEVVQVPAVSGRKPSKELCLALDRLARGEAAGLIVTKLDRLTRSAQVASEIINIARAEGWNLVMLDMGLDLSTASGKAFAQVLGVFAEFEREAIVERVLTGLASARANGTKSGRPIGRPVLVEPDVVKYICEQRGEGTSYRLIAQDLTAQGIASPAGLPTWHASTVRRVCERARGGAV
jgi:DNA invertase Pin-like site-specific DNA recombinase